MRSLAVASLAAFLGVPAAGAGAPTTRHAPAAIEFGSFACYAATFAEFASRSVRLYDQFGRRSATVGRPESLCFPAGVNGSSASGRRAHLTCYPLQTGVDPPRRDVDVTSTIGVLKLTVGRPLRLCVATSIATGSLLRSPPSTLDHFTCYAIRLRQQQRAATIVVAAASSTTRDLVGAATSLCVPAGVNSPRRLQSLPLACYAVRSTARARSAVVRNLFGLFQPSLGLRESVCVPPT
jgi:hypothetical protein